MDGWMMAMQMDELQLKPRRLHAWIRTEDMDIYLSSCGVVWYAVGTLCPLIDDR